MTIQHRRSSASKGTKSRRSSATKSSCKLLLIPPLDAMRLDSANIEDIGTTPRTPATGLKRVVSLIVIDSRDRRRRNVWLKPRKRSKQCRREEEQRSPSRSPRHSEGGDVKEPTTLPFARTDYFSDENFFSTPVQDRYPSTPIASGSPPFLSMDFPRAPAKDRAALPDLSLKPMSRPRFCSPRRRTSRDATACGSPAEMEGVVVFPQSLFATPKTP